MDLNFKILRIEKAVEWGLGIFLRIFFCKLLICSNLRFFDLGRIWWARMKGMGRRIWGWGDNLAGNCKFERLRMGGMEVLSGF